MLHDEPVLLAPNFSMIVRWSPRVDDFVHEWERRQFQDHPERPLEFWAEAAMSALSGVEQGRHQAQSIMADLYHLGGLLPATGDLLVVEPLDLKVDQRHITHRQIGEATHVEVVIYLGVERYRYEAPSTQTPRSRRLSASAL
ncbi:hypothetical protein JAO73_22370 [Hymenobacter sp. BT523]|uniref:hypothetical protein n=1 Tax=Hymenobacter sp. BT523 TaxID=2795725 RepID=UPI0018EBD95F|nr:hypothetical protein [Hymenobacter sp. BT523]MBJ6111782.1 hypothetical protein [Hymenobacter sp. BT523]